MVSKYFTKVIEGILSLYILRLFTFIFSFLFSIIVAWYVGAVGVGKLALITIFPSLSLMIFSIRIERGFLFFSTNYHRKKNYEKVRDFFYGYIIFKASTGLIVSILNLLLADFIATSVFHDNTLTPLIKLYTIAIIPSALFELNELYFRTKLMFKEWAASSAFLATLRTLLAYVLLVSSWGLIGLIFVEAIWYSISFLIGLIGLMIYLHKNKIPLISFSLRSSLYEVRKCIEYSAPLFIGSFFGIVRENIGLLLLGYFLNTRIVGIFCIARELSTRIINLFNPIYTTATTIAFDYYHAKGEKRFHESITELLKFSLVLTFPVFFFCTIFSEEIIAFFYPEEFIEGGNLMRIFLIDVILLAISNPLSTYFIAGGRPWFIGKLSLLDLVSVSVASILLIPILGPLGAAIAYITPSAIRDLLLWIWAKPPSISRHITNVLLSNTPSVVFVYIMRIIAIYLGIWSQLSKPIIAILFFAYFAIFSLTFYEIRGYKQFNTELIDKTIDNLPTFFRICLKKVLGMLEGLKSK